ncbi:MAG: hypothetical protein WBK19_06545 [Azonexus sp.]
MARIVGQKPAPAACHFDAKSLIAEIVNYSIVDYSLDVNNVSTSNPFVAAIQTYRTSPVATLSTLPAGGIIESAGAFFGNSTPNTARHQGSPESNKQKHAMARRLEQLHNALGESEVAPAKAANIKNSPVVVESIKSFGTGTLIITAMISALCGAAMMWLGAPQGAPRSVPAPQPLAVAAPQAAIAMLSEPVPSAPATTEISDKTRVGELLDTWRNAWVQRDIASYLNAYGQHFAPNDGSSRDAWVAARTKKLSAGAPIDIQIREIGIERLNADQFKATFLQDYASGSYRETARTKVLLIARENGEWKITKEWLEENKLAMK